jgi:hypothetical protein
MLYTLDSQLSGGARDQPLFICIPYQNDDTRFDPARFMA